MSFSPSRSQARARASRALEVVGLGLESFLRPLERRTCPLGDRQPLAGLADRDIDEHPVAEQGLVLGVVPREQVAVTLGGDAGRRGLAPDAGIPHAAVGRAQGVERPGDQLGVIQGLLGLGQIVIGRPEVEPGVVIAGFLGPEGGVALGGLAADACHVTRDVDREEFLRPVLLVLSANLVGRLPRGEPPVPAVAGPNGRDAGARAVGIRAEPHGAVSRFAESLGGRDELVQRHRLAESEPLGEHPLCRLDPAHEGGIGLYPRWIERRIVPGVRGFLGKLGLENRQDLFRPLLGDREEAHIRLGSATMSSSASRSGSSLA